MTAETKKPEKRVTKLTTKKPKSRQRSLYEACAYVLNGSDSATERGAVFGTEETLFFILSVLMQLPKDVIQRLCPKHIDAARIYMRIDDRRWRSECMHVLPRVLSEWLAQRPDRMSERETPLLRDRSVEEHERLLEERWTKLTSEDAADLWAVRERLFEAMGVDELTLDAVAVLCRPLRSSCAPEASLLDTVVITAVRALPVFLKDADAFEASYHQRAFGWRLLAG